MTRRLTVTAVAVLSSSYLSCRGAPSRETGNFDFVENRRSAEVRASSARLSSLAPSALEESFVFRDETRRAFATPLGLSMTFHVRIPRVPSMRFAVAASTMGKTGRFAPVTFRVYAEIGAERELVFEQVVRRRHMNSWHPGEIDLSVWSGRKIGLSFEATSASNEGVLPLWGSPVLVDRERAPEKPNIILVSIDCLRRDHLHSYGYERDTSPNIDALAADGVLFRQAVSTSTYTLPTHASILTGLLPSFHGATFRRRLSSKVAYAPELLSRAGYRVVGLVSAPFLSHIYGFDRGFSTYRLVSDRAENLVDKAIQILRQGQGQSQFLFFHLFDAHWPYTPPREFLTRFGDRPRDISKLLEIVEKRVVPQNGEQIDQIERLYDGEIAYLDQALGRLFHELRAMGIYDRTMIVLTGDHGEAFFEHGHWEHARPWSTDGPGAYEEVVGVPLIVKWPGASPRGQVDEVVSQVDIFPTILHVAGLGGTTRWGRDLTSYLARSETPPRRVVTELVTKGKSGSGAFVAFRSDRFKYVATFSSSETLDGTTLQKEELYDLLLDADERSNLVETDSARLKTFRSALRNYLRDRRSGMSNPGDEITMEQEVLEKLRALGYVEP